MGVGFGKILGGIGTLAAFVPGGQGVAAVAGTAAAMMGPEGAETLNPYRWTPGPFEPFGTLWGIPRIDAELNRWEFNARVMGHDTGPYAAMLRSEIARRGGPERVWGRRLVVTSWANRDLIAITARDPNDGRVIQSLGVPVSAARLILEGWQQRIAAHGDREPVFPYIDKRTWQGGAWLDAWHDRYQPSSALGTGFKYGLNRLKRERDDWRDLRTPASRAAYDDWIPGHLAALDAQTAETERWLQWRADLADQRARQEQEQELLERFRQAWDSVAAGDLTPEQAVGTVTWQHATAPVGVGLSTQVGMNQQTDQADNDPSAAPAGALMALGALVVLFLVLDA